MSGMLLMRYLACGRHLGCARFPRGSLGSLTMTFLARGVLLGASQQEPRRVSLQLGLTHKKSQEAAAPRETIGVFSSGAAQSLNVMVRQRPGYGPPVLPLPLESPSLPVVVTSQSLMLKGMKKRARECAGAKRLKIAMDKKRRARERQKLHTWHARALMGGETVLETLATSGTTSGVYLGLLRSFWDLAGSLGVVLKSDREFDNLASDWCDREFLNGEASGNGEKLLAALARWALVHRQRGVLELPRMKINLRSWKKNAPRRSRMPMPELFSWAIGAYLGHKGFCEMALYQLSLFETLLRPSALLDLKCGDIVGPQRGASGHTVILVSPFEREKSTKTASYDETCVLDGPFKEHGGLLLELARKKVSEASSRLGRQAAAEEVALWNFSARDFFAAWKNAVLDLELPQMESVYQSRHGGASRDYLEDRRSATELMLRMHHNSLSSTRLYNKPGRVQQVRQQAKPGVVWYGGRAKENFVKWYRDGSFPPPPRPPVKRRTR